MSSNVRPHSPSAVDSCSKRVCIQAPAESAPVLVTEGGPAGLHAPETPTGVAPGPKEIQHQPNNDRVKACPTLRKNSKGRKRKQKKPISSGDQSIEHSIRELLGDEKYEELLEKETNWKASGWELERGNVIEMKIVDIGSFGDGLAVAPNQNWVVVVPFTVPGDVVQAKIYRHESLHSYADLVSVISPGDWRDDSLVKCKYFGKCSGCQYQMLSYSKQLELKQVVVEKAFKHFSGLDPAILPPVEPTLPSPSQYEYRTKLTPHFELPRNIKLANKAFTKKFVEQDIGNGDLSIGFAEKGRKRVLDIEECPIATRVINDKLIEERSRVQSTIQNFKRGATLLFRDSIVPLTTATGVVSCGDNVATPSEETNAHVCITDHKQIVHEKVLSSHFEQNAGSFFQNNSSILDPFMNYIVSLLTPSKSDSYLVDAYCGSGLFSICLAQHFTKATGIELSADSIRWAKHNAILNKVDNASFMVGQAEAIFKGLDFPPSQTTVIIDPPRKGCDDQFIQQLLSFKPQSILYVSCNVHTQARDVGLLAQVYQVKRIRGADFFPQSHHCESIVALNLIGS
ncbi:hypothetical protein CROQUDRAFT_46003 [Cronartium quercuum f. sp. fusiforme G11]|uniref:TRAM domain-containing protein n=1 Tax=Cronartium quercuum f. sp. fusiforme G11 TaxID=708437 RepID=A0A9P6NG13_9BASI|nr:hypothetical protein CROQUDRAFT_46003 [Cronartium quercuum f. sp. fusiforme G11]